MSASSILTENDYGAWLSELKGRVQARQMRAALAVNSELVLLYWEIGTSILEKQKQEGYGTKVIDRLAKDLRSVFPEMKGFSPRNLKYMRAFAESWPESEVVQEVLAQLSWYHHVALLDKLKDRIARTWYAKAAIEYGWSRNILVMQIETRLYEREGKAITNFAQRLPAPQSDLAAAVLKDPYVFDFLGLGREAQERTIENALVDHIVRFLLELGAGFAFVGRQVHLEVGGDDFFIDLLFYHLKLRCYVVVELKATSFKPEYTGQLNFYLSAVDGLLRHEHDQPTIGLLLCKSQNRIVAEYALKDIAKPMGVAEYQLIEALPKELETNLPSIERIEAELGQTDEKCDGDSISGRG
ncbi:MAG: PDDEXK nuclease domain-containing protein [Burkholderia gladioli]